MKIATSGGKNGTSIWGKRGGNMGKQGEQRLERGQAVFKAYYHILSRTDQRISLLPLLPQGDRIWSK